MKRIRKIAERLWRERYGNALYVTDFHGNYMVFDGYGKPDCMRLIHGEMTYCGWNIHHIFPHSKGGRTSADNLECTNIITNRLAADKTTYWIEGKKYQIRRKGKGYKIVKL